MIQRKVENLCENSRPPHSFVSQNACLNPLCLITGLERLSSLVTARMMITGYKRPLEEKDLWSLNSEDCSQKVVPQLVRRWNAECQKVKRSEKEN